MQFISPMCKLSPWLAAALLLSVSCGKLALAANGTARAAGEAYMKCSAPLLREEGPLQEEGATGFGVEVDGERYFFIIRDRVKFTVRSVQDGLAVAEVLVDQPPDDEFGEQKGWRERYLAEVADRAGVALERQ
jgi:hypothetical protein